jgi:hypothetical protein
MNGLNAESDYCIQAGGSVDLFPIHFHLSFRSKRGVVEELAFCRIGQIDLSFSNLFLLGIPGIAGSARSGVADKPGGGRGRNEKGPGKQRVELSRS